MNKGIKLLALLLFIPCFLNASEVQDTTDLLYRKIFEIDFENSDISAISGKGLNLSDFNSSMSEGQHALEIATTQGKLNFNIQLKALELSRNTLVTFDYKVDQNMIFKFKFTGRPLVLPKHQSRLVKGEWRKMVIHMSDLITLYKAKVPDKIMVSQIYMQSSHSGRVLIDNFRILSPKFEL